MRALPSPTTTTRVSTRAGFAWWGPALALVLACIGCTSGHPGRTDALTINAQWQAGDMPPDSMDKMLEAIHNLGEGKPEAPGSLTTLCRIAMSSPSALVRAEALQAAWGLGSQIPAEDYRADTVDSATFNARAMRLDRMLDGEEVGEGEDVFVLIDWVGSFRFPPARVALALDLAEAVTSRALVHPGPISDAFQRHAGGSLRHALTLVTMYAADDKSALVRQQAATAARYLAPQAALLMLAGMLQREPESQVVFDALESLTILRWGLSNEDVLRLVEPLQLSHDVAVRRSADDLAASLARG